MPKELKLLSIPLVMSSNHEIEYHAVIDYENKRLVAIVDAQDWGTEGRILIHKEYEAQKEEIINFVKMKKQRIFASGVDLKGAVIPKIKIELVGSFIEFFKLF